MAHDDQIGHLEHAHCNSSAALVHECQIGLVRRHQIGDVAQYEELARLGVEDHRGVHPAVRAATTIARGD